MISDIGKYTEKTTYIRISDGKEEIIEFFPEDREFFFLREKRLHSSIEKRVQQEKGERCFAGKASFSGIA